MTNIFDTRYADGDKFESNKEIFENIRKRVNAAIHELNQIRIYQIFVYFKCLCLQVLRLTEDFYRITFQPVYEKGEFISTKNMLA